MKLKRIIRILVIALIAFAAQNSFFSDKTEYDEKIIKGFYDCRENEKVVPGDAVCYSEYYYKEDIKNKIKENYTAVTKENIDSVTEYMNIFKERFLYDTDKGNKAFMERLTIGDYYSIDTGCSAELSENHFRLYYYDGESNTVYYMWRCQ